MATSNMVREPTQLLLQTGQGNLLNGYFKQGKGTYSMATSNRVRNLHNGYFKQGKGTYAMATSNRVREPTQWVIEQGKGTYFMGS